MDRKNLKQNAWQYWHKQHMLTAYLYVDLHRHTSGEQDKRVYVISHTLARDAIFAELKP